MRLIVIALWMSCMLTLPVRLSASSPDRWIDTLPTESVVLDGYMSDGIEERMDIEASSPIEDVWKLVATGGLIAVERVEPRGADVGSADCYRMVVLRAPDRAVRPGTVMGYLQPTAAGVIAVERVEPRGADVGSADCYRMVVLRAPDRAVRPGTVMGYLQPTAAGDTYEANIYTDTDGDGTLRGAKSFRVVVSEDAMQFYRVRSGLSVNIFRLLPYMFRRAVDYRPDDHNGLDGCVRYRDCSFPRYF